jgi:hypothetical protein
MTSTRKNIPSLYAHRSHFLHARCPRRTNLPSSVEQPQSYQSQFPLRRCAYKCCVSGVRNPHCADRLISVLETAECDCEGEDYCWRLGVELGWSVDVSGKFSLPLYVLFALSLDL